MILRTALSVLSLLVLSIASASAITVEEIIKNHIEARGGTTAIKDLKSLRIEATMQTMGGEMKAVQLFKGGNKMRMDMEIQGMSITQAYDGKTGWMMNPMMGSGAQKVSDEQAQGMAQQASFAGDLISAGEFGYTLEAAGSEDLDGMTAYKVKVTNKDGETWYTFVDAITWLIVRTDRTMEMAGQTFEVQVYFSNFKTISGVQLPTQIDMKAGGQDFMSMTWDKIEPNVEISDEKFAYPGE